MRVNAFVPGLATALVASFAAFGAFAEGPVPYLDCDANGAVSARTCESYTVLGDAYHLNLTDGTYVVTGEVTVANGIEVSGNVSLILTDGSKLTAQALNPTDARNGILVWPGRSLTVYGQEEGTGTLVATASFNRYAGIGGPTKGTGGDITILGGRIVATGGPRGPGIGGAYDAGGGRITIRRAEVTANGDLAIGAANLAAETVVTIGAAARIVHTGVIQAKECHIANCHFKTKPPQEILEKGYAALASLLIDPLKDEYPYCVLPAFKVTIPNVNRYVTVDWDCGSVISPVKGSATGETVSFYVLSEGSQVSLKFTALPGTTLTKPDTFRLYPLTGDYTVPASAIPDARSEPIRYIDVDGTERTLDQYIDFNAQTVDRNTLKDGYWYVVKGESACFGVTVEGSAKLVLSDGARLSVQGDFYEAGLGVGESSELTIFGQAGQTGRLVATGGPGGAGIGGGRQGQACGKLTIAGGTVVARGGMRGAGIGGASGGSGGTVEIVGGRVTATRGESCTADVGAGDGGSGATVTVSGGVFGMEVQEPWPAAGYRAFPNEDPATKGEFPTVVLEYRTVRVDSLYRNMSAVWTRGDGAETNPLVGDIVVRKGDNVRITFVPDAKYHFNEPTTIELSPVTEDVRVERGRIPVPHTVPVAYVDPAGGERTIDTYSYYTGQDTLDGDEWYVVSGRHSLSRLLVRSGLVNLILCDGAEIVAANSDNTVPAVWLGPDASGLTVWGQKGQTGALRAYGSFDACGIGCPENGRFGTVRINGGTVVAVGGVRGTEYYHSDTFGIGVQRSDLETKFGRIEINGGRIFARGNGGTTREGLCSNADICLTGGVCDFDLDRAWCADNRDIFDNPDPNTASAYPKAILPAARITVGELENIRVFWTADYSPTRQPVEGGAFKILSGATGVRVFLEANAGYALKEGRDEFDFAQVTGDVTIERPAYMVPVAHANEWVTYVDADGVTRATDVYTVLTGDRKTLRDGVWYVLKDDVRVEDDSFTVEKTAHLILKDGCTLDVRGRSPTLSYHRADAGIIVESPAELTIYGQEGGTGTLIATGGTASEGSAAGIGGNAYFVTPSQYEGSRGGKVTICGGRIRATGGWRAADIGGGRNLYGSGNVGSDKITVYGGAFGMNVEKEWCDDGYAVFANPDASSRDAFPQVVLPSCTVTLGALGKMRAEWISGDGAVTTAVDGVAFTLPKGTENVKVRFIPSDTYRLSGPGLLDLGRITESMTVEPARLPQSYATVFVPVGKLGFAAAEGRRVFSVTIPARKDVTYALRRGADFALPPGLWPTVKSVGATAAGEMTVTDENPPEGAAFYAIEAL